MLTEPHLRQQLDLTFEDQENKENQSQNILLLPQSLQVIKADQQAKDAKALLGMMKRSTVKSPPSSNSQGRNS